MKKIVSLVICIVMLSVTCITAFAWETPQLKLSAAYNEKEQEITVEYRVLDFAGTESADFRLKYDSAVVELTDYEANKPDGNSFVEIGTTEADKISIQYINMYYMSEEGCEEDGSAVIATFTFKVIDEAALETVFIATADSCNMDPDSKEVTVKRDTLKLNFAEAASENAQESVFENENMKKAIFGAVVAFVIFVAVLVGIVVKYRKQ
ncbi:MAG: hypothetical protein IJZ35_04510 [Clostridia bacterium]|nr:hypothetical protein [Clostridia bacterium]